jgi:lactoylglutathione lyase
MKIYIIACRILFVLLTITTIKVSAQMKKHPTINHLALSVFNLEKSTDFYKNIIGLKMIPEPFHDGKHSWFQIAKHTQLHLILSAPSVTEHDKNSHMCFTISSIDKVIEVLNKNNIWFGNWLGNANMITIRPDGVKQIFFKDPEGYWIEINNDTY